MSLTPRRRHRPSSQQGAALVEFALVLPVFALMLFGMVQLGIVFAGWAQLRNAVQTGAREASLGALVTSSQCGPSASPACALALQIGLPPGLSPNLMSSAPLPSADGCTPTLASCHDCPEFDGYSWLDGAFIYLSGSWQQIVSSPPCSSQPLLKGQVGDQAAFTAGVAAGWSCSATDPKTGNCTEITTNVKGAAQGALGAASVAMSCVPSSSKCQASSGDQLVVCASLPATAFTAFLPAINVSTESSFYMETGTATTFSEGNVTCG